MSSSSVTSVTSHFYTPNEGFSTTTSGPVTSGAATVGLTSTTGLTNATVFVGIIEPSGTKEQVFTGIVDTGGSQITGVIWTKGTNVDHATGVTIVDYVTGTGPKMMTKGLLVEHTQAGLHALTSSSTLTSSKVITSLNDTNGNELFKVTPTASAVNEFTVANAATGNAPVLSATGGDTDVGITISPKSAGKLTLNNLYNPYKFSVYMTGAASAGAIVPFDTKNFDTGSNFNTTTHLFTAPITGLYFFTAVINFNITGITGYSAYLKKNGTTDVGLVTQITQGTASAYGLSISRLLSLTASDTIGVYTSGTASAIFNNNNQTFFDGYFISAT